MEGELRIDVCLTGTTFAAEGSPFSITPNSFVDNPVGEGLADDAASPPTWTLVRRVDPDIFNGGDAVVEVRLDIRGILVGVSFDCDVKEFISDDAGSFASLKACEPLVPFMPTDGDPAIVGKRLRERREESDCFCIELTVCDVSLEVDEDVREIEGAPDEDVDKEVFNRATRCAVAGSKADICIGGRLTGDLGFRGSVEDSV